MSELKTKSTSKKLRSNVTGLVRDAEEYLPNEFHERLRTVSKLFFEHRREGGRVAEQLEAAQGRAKKLEEELATSEHGQADLQTEIEELHRDIESLRLECREQEVALQELKRDHASELSVQKQSELSARYTYDELLLRIGDVAQGKYACVVRSVERSSRANIRLSQGDLNDSQVEQAVRRAVGFFVSQLEPDDCIYDWYPTELRAMVRATGQSPTELSIVIDSTKSQKNGEPIMAASIEEVRNEFTRTYKRMSTGIDDWLDNTPLDDRTVKMYQSRLQNGENLPAIVVWEHDGKTTVIDGRHRLMAMVRCGFEELTGYYTVRCTPEEAAELRRKLNSQVARSKLCDMLNQVGDMEASSDQIIANPPFGNRNGGSY